MSIGFQLKKIVTLKKQSQSLLDKMELEIKKENMQN